MGKENIMTIAAQIRSCIKAIPLGEPFTPTKFSAYGTRSAIDQTLYRLVKNGEIKRISRGIFVRPEVNRFIGDVMPEPVKVIKTLAKATGATIQVHGAEAARQLELSTQTPMRPIFLTSGSNRSFKIGNIKVTLRHTSARKLLLADSPAGLALTALWYLGKELVNTATIEKIRQKLPASEFEALKSSVPEMPAWMSNTFFRYECAKNG
jgi:hypothetical protein